MTARILIFLHCFIMLCSLVRAQVFQEWASFNNGSFNSNDYSYIITVDNAGNVFVAGTETVSLNNTDIVVIKYNSSGALQWKTSYGGTANSNDYPYAIKSDNIGNIYLTGTVISSSTTYDYITLKLNSLTGAVLWASLHDGVVHGTDISHALDVDNAGNVFVTGESQGLAQDIVTIKYGPNGNELWEKSFNSYIDVGTSLSLDNAGNVCVAGYTYVGNNYDFITIKYDPSGNLLWYDVINNPAGHDITTALKVDKLNNIIVAGKKSTVSNGEDFQTVKYDNAGNKLWISTFNGTANNEDEAYSLDLDSMNNIFVTGHCTNIGSGPDYATIKYLPDGTQSWVKYYNGPSASANDYGRYIATDKFANVYVTGFSSNLATPPNYDFATIKYSNSGEEKWIQRFQGMAQMEDKANMLVVDNNNCVYVTGWSYNSNYDFATVKYYSCNLSAFAGNDTTIYHGYGGGAVLSAAAFNGVSPFTYLWSNGAVSQSITVSPDITTSYFVKITDSKGCIAYDTVVVNVINVSCANNGNPDKVLVCHNGRTICVDNSAVPAHLAHGDVLGSCGNQGEALTEVTGDPKEFTLYNNYPNPFNPSTTIRYYIPDISDVKIVIYDVIGREVYSVVNDNQVAGKYEMIWNASSKPSGIYICRMEIESNGNKYSKIMKMMLIK